MQTNWSEALFIFFLFIDKASLLTVLVIIFTVLHGAYNSIYCFTISFGALNLSSYFETGL